MPVIRALDHVGIHVADVAASESFYRGVLGLAPLPRPELGFPGAWLRIGSAQELHLIGRNAQQGVPPKERHFALEIDDAGAWAETLTAHGLSFTGPGRRPDGAQQIFVRDPDGHVIELLQRPR